MILEQLGFFESLFTSIVGLSIVFMSLIFLAIFVMIVSKVIAGLEATVLKKETVTPSAAPAAAAPVKKDNKEAVKIAVITAAVSEELKEPIDKFVITNIQKI